MNATEVIDAAIKSGQENGLLYLTDLQRKIFLVSEAEVICDMEGIDSFLHKYGQNLSECAGAFESIGAHEIASTLNLILQLWPKTNEPLLAKANQLITDRVGYQYESIHRFVEDNI